MLAVARLFIGDRLNVEEMVEATAFVAESQADEGRFLEGGGDGCGEWRLEISEEVKLEGSGTLDPVLDAVLDSGTEEVEEFERGVVGVEGGDRDETWASEPEDAESSASGMLQFERKKTHSNCRKSTLVQRSATQKDISLLFAQCLQDGTRAGRYERRRAYCLPSPRSRVEGRCRRGRRHRGRGCRWECRAGCRRGAWSGGRRRRPRRRGEKFLWGTWAYR